MELKTIDVQEVQEHLSDYQEQAVQLRDKLEWVTAQVKKYEDVLAVIDEMETIHKPRPKERLTKNRYEYVKEVLAGKPAMRWQDIYRGMIGAGWAEGTTKHAMYQYLNTKKELYEKVGTGKFRLKEVRTVAQQQEERGVLAEIVGEERANALIS